MWRSCPDWPFSLLHVMRRSWSMPDVISYSAATRACEDAQQGERSLGLLHVMRRSLLKPDAISYRAAISAGEVARHLRSQAKIHRDMVAVRSCLRCVRG